MTSRLITKSHSDRSFTSKSRPKYCIALKAVIASVVEIQPQSSSSTRILLSDLRVTVHGKRTGQLLRKESGTINIDQEREKGLTYRIGNYSDRKGKWLIFVWLLTVDQSDKGMPTRNLVPVSLALRIIKAHKPPYHDKVLATGGHF